MAKYQGIVNVVTAKDFPAGPRGPATTLHGFALKGMDGFFGLGKSSHPLVTKGAEIEFEANEKRVVEHSSVRLAGAAPLPKGASNASAVPVQSAYQAGEAMRQKSISWQSGRKDSIEVVDMMLRNGAISLPKTAAKAQEALLGYIDEMTLRFFQDTLGVDEQPVSRKDYDKVSDDAKDEDDDSFGEAR